MSERPALRSVALPTEHGGWSLTLEPVALGLLVEPSVAGAALGLAAFVAFLARTPLRLVLVDRYRRRNLPRTRLARVVLSVEVVAIAVLVAVAAATGSQRFWWVVAAAAPLVVIELRFDLRSRSRYLIPELAGTVGIAVVAAAIPLAGDHSVSASLGLWLIASSRAVASIPFVRLQLSRVKAEQVARWGSDLAQLLAVTAAVAGLALEVVSPAAVVAIIVLVLAQLILSRLEVPPVPIVGAQQVVLGLAVVVTTALGAIAP